MYEKTPCDFAACRGEYIRAALGSERALLFHWNDFGVSSVVRARKLSAIESAVIVVISDVLTACVAKSQSAELLLSVSCSLFTLLICAISIVSCYLCYVFSYTFVNKPPFSIILRVRLFTPYIHSDRNIFVTICSLYALYAYVYERDNSKTQ
ncbi:hypothetical protein AVEN_266125-1 [Araneus ventricosus]|uniref:Uncharacterized protein n=1 Tax=Araneus ventricosus TaxID=182803 RepID=A0A4Y2G7U4_ARAVE|nr:hypothetical protein AVEN_266125-1 [Araneus ventricosus]